MYIKSSKNSQSSVIMNPNPGNKLPSRERTELEKYVRFLVFKMSQVIVQSRFGEKRKAISSSKSSFHDWFNLAIEDNSEIQVKAKEAYSNITPLKDFCICTEILLKTADGDTLVLETWSLRMSTSDFFCDSPHISYTSLASVYSRMTLLLKSVIAVTRITPAYKLSSRQSADMYVILFRIYPGEPQVHHLGEHYERSKIGEILTPVGTIKMSVSYRSKDDMTITPQKVDKGSPFMMKSDYFKPDMSPHKIPSGGIRIEKNLNCNKSSNGIWKGAFVPSNFCPDLSASFPELAMFEKFEKSFRNLSRSKLVKREIKQDGSNQNSDKNANLNLANYTKETKDERGVDYTKSCLNSNISSNDMRKVGAFAPSGGYSDVVNAFPQLGILEKPFLKSRSKLINSEIKQDDSNQNSDKNANLNFTNYTKDERGVDYNCNPNERREEKLISSDESSGSSNVNVKPPFAVGSELQAFFHDFQSAPPLASFASQPTLEQVVSDISSQIKKYEECMEEIDNFVDSFSNTDLDK